jgi:hypothetical protein
MDETIAGIEYCCLPYGKTMVGLIGYGLSFFGIFLRGSTGTSLLGFSQALKKTDVIQSRKVMKISGTFHFVENCSLYHFQ